MDVYSMKLTTEKYDLIVVGTGFASTFFLYQYLKKAPANRKILVLEAGHFFSQKDRRKDLSSDKGSSLNPNPEPHEKS